MDTSSKKMVIRRPPGGPNVLPVFFSMSESMDSWNMRGMVADEKLIFLSIISSVLNLSVNWYTVADLAVPEPPRTMTDLFRP